MKRNRPAKIVLISLILLLITTSLSLAQGSGYSISRWSFSGGSSHSGGGYQLYAIAGQADAGVRSGEGYTLTGGVRPKRLLPQAPRQEKIYVPMVVRGP